MVKEIRTLGLTELTRLLSYMTCQSFYDSVIRTHRVQCFVLCVQIVQIVFCTLVHLFFCKLVHEYLKGWCFMGYTLGNSVLEKQTSDFPPIVGHLLPTLLNILFTL